jgi:GMP synthase PP-ATPase subunit
MSKNDARDLDNLTRVITRLPADEAARLLKEVKGEKDAEEKRRIIKHALKKKGLTPL